MRPSPTSQPGADIDGAPPLVRVIAFYLLTLFLADGVAGAVSSDAAGKTAAPPLDAGALLSAALVYGVTALVVTLAFVSRWDRRPLRTLGVARPIASLGDYAFGALLGGAGAGLAVGAAALLGGVSVRWLPGPAAGWGAFFAATLGWVAAGFAGELSHRGYALQLAARRFGARNAVIALALISAFLQGGRPVEAPVAFANQLLFGVVAGVAYVRTGSLLFAAAMNTGWNLVLGPLLGLRVSGQPVADALAVSLLSGPDPLTGGGYGPEGGLAVTWALALTAAIFLLPLRWRNEENARAWDLWIFGPPWPWVRTGFQRPRAFVVAPHEKMLLRWSLRSGPEEANVPPGESEPARSESESSERPHG
ncbi:MAG: CPBP family intramembrane metalloprotease [Planctomycetes bacterium]|nr:CPBP family intramembrane metalloprotease [Planctomycetota bacterium]